MSPHGRRFVLTIIVLLALCPVSSSTGGHSPAGAGRNGGEAVSPEAARVGGERDGPQRKEAVEPAVPPIEVEKIEPTLAVIRIAGISSVVLAGSGGVLVVDPGLEETAPFLKEEIRKLGWGAVRVVIDTHWHFDHAGGNKFFASDSAILASGTTRELLSEDRRLIGMDLPAYPDEARPRAVNPPAESIPGFAEKVTLRMAPGGHTGGDLLVHFEKSGVVAIGDIVFAGQFPFVDVDHGGNVVVLADLLASLVDEYPSDTRFIPGHGPVLARDDLLAYRRMILDTTEMVREEISQGRSLEEMQRSAILAKWQQWDGSFKQNDWIGFIHESLRRGAPMKEKSSSVLAGTESDTSRGDQMVEKDLLALEKGAMERWRKGDPMRWAEISAEEVTYVDPDLTKPIVGLDEYTRLLSGLAGKVRYDRSEFINPRVAVHGDAAVLSYNYRSTVNKPDGSVLDQTHWNATEVYARLEGEWKIIHTHWSYVGSRRPESVEVPVPVELNPSAHEGTPGEILALEAAAMERWRKGDPGGFLEISAPEVTYFDTGTRSRLDGMAALEAEYAGRTGRIRYDVMEFIGPRVQVHGEMAVLTYRFFSTRLNEDGSVAERTAWNCTEVFARIDGAWKIVHTHWSYINGQEP